MAHPIPFTHCTIFHPIRPSASVLSTLPSIPQCFPQLSIPPVIHTRVQPSQLHLFACSPTHSLTPSLPHSLTPSLPHSLTPSLPHSLTPSLPHSPHLLTSPPPLFLLPHLLPPILLSNTTSITYPPSYTETRPLTHSLTPSPSHSLYRTTKAKQAIQAVSMRFLSIL
jgi:hypothetical protein